ncbi:polyprenol monophosphomannose synthase [Armatimonas sp.]|uniref:polyprenol monophosphomannose synthase n=1 Tax=Armatimonas sp. TaxID=1872638 RepID=UPI00286A52E7|nr:polyprenol monophosphomannose synthase [Armatimonas sp.]
MPESPLIITPTYNEKENLPTLIAQLRQSVPEAHLLVVDDGSPDGTGKMADALATQDPHVHVLHRTTKDGLGRAYVAGFSWGLEQGYTRLVQMDADLSHNPADVPRLLAADADLVIGSRYVAGGGTVNWGLSRRLLSRGGCLYARTILGLPLQDLTGGFKCWRRAALEAVNLPEIRSNGYSFQIEMTWRALQAGFKATEVPILFTDRVDGVSKMSKRIVFEAVGMVWRLRLGRAPSPHHEAKRP